MSLEICGRSEWRPATVGLFGVMGLVGCKGVLSMGIVQKGKKSIRLNRTSITLAFMRPLSVTVD